MISLIVLTRAIFQSQVAVYLLDQLSDSDPSIAHAGQMVGNTSNRLESQSRHQTSNVAPADLLSDMHNMC